MELPEDKLGEMLSFLVQIGPMRFRMRTSIGSLLLFGLINKRWLLSPGIQMNMLYVDPSG